ncbi:MAG: FHA domain-containing protein [Bacteroidales bacterium]|nr:FHA domain-containing protein [Bacteroidales bacterium]
MPKLTIIAGPNTGQSFDLTGPSITVGRHSSNPIPLQDNRVSRKHMELRLTASRGYQLYDLESGNGTIVNGRSIRVIDLRHGDRIEIGDSVLRYELDGPAKPSPLSRDEDRTERLRLVVQPGTDLPSAILRSVAADAGSEMLRRPQTATTDWLKTRLANLTVLYEAANAVSAILDVDELLGRVVDLILHSTDADHGCVLLRDPETGDLIPKAVRSRKPAVDTGEFVISRTVADYVLRERQGILTTDATNDERFRGGESVARHRLHEIICVPMTSRHETVGVLFLDTQEPPTNSGSTQVHRSPDGMRFSEDHLRLAVAVAHQAALAVEETRYYQAMVQSERLAAVGQTIAALSHHIKNIMQGVRFGSDMVRMGLDGDDQELIRKGWRLVEKNQIRIDELILDMLSYSKEREPGFEPTAINDIVADVLEVVRGRANDAQVELTWTPGTLPLIESDSEGIHRALLNVVSNAVDATEGRTPARVALTTRLADDGQFVEIIVTDTGGGIPPDKLKLIFKPFVSTKGARGTGLGLSVSRKTLREHGGDVLVDNAIGDGATFTLRLPLTPGKPGPTPSAQRPPEE